MGSSPIASSILKKHFTKCLKENISACLFSDTSPGGVPERSKGTDCKSVGQAFEGSNPSPSTIILLLCEVRDIQSGNSSIGRASAFQAEGCEFESRFPLHFLFLIVGYGAHVAQSVERILGKDEVTGSNPVVGSSSVWGVTGALRELYLFLREGFSALVPVPVCRGLAKNPF